MEGINMEMKLKDLNQRLVGEVLEMLIDEVLEEQETENIDIIEITNTWQSNMCYSNNSKSKEILFKYALETLLSHHWIYSLTKKIRTMDETGLMLQDLYMYISRCIINEYNLCNITNKIELIETLRKAYYEDDYINWSNLYDTSELEWQISNPEWDEDDSGQEYMILETLVNGANGIHCPKLLFEKLELPELDVDNDEYLMIYTDYEYLINKMLKEWWKLHSQKEYHDYTLIIESNPDYGDIELRVYNK